MAARAPKRDCAAGLAALAEFRRDVDCRFLRPPGFKRTPGCRCFGCGVQETLVAIDADYASRRH